MLFGLLSYTITYYTRSIDYETSAIDGRFPNKNPLRTVPYFMYHRAMSSFFELHQTNAYSSGPRSVDADG